MTKQQTDLEGILVFLGSSTPQSWLELAVEPENLPILLIDHANCEKKAASTALNLLYRYVDHYPLLHKLSRLAREELRHFEQVITLMKRRKVDYLQLSASRYASGLRGLVRSREPERLVDTLLVGAFIEARSCERFACLAPLLDTELGDFYSSLLKSEARHYRDYLALAASATTEDEIEQRCGFIRERESQLVHSGDVEFRFHSGSSAVPQG